MERGREAGGSQCCAARFFLVPPILSTKEGERMGGREGGKEGLRERGRVYV
jgi:hypothetical protein